VEASGLVMFWAVPVFYSIEMVPPRYQQFIMLNPIAAVAVAGRRVLFDAASPSANLVLQLSGVSLAILVMGFVVFRWLERDFADYL